MPSGGGGAGGGGGGGGGGFGRGSRRWSTRNFNRTNYGHYYRSTSGDCNTKRTICFISIATTVFLIVVLLIVGVSVGFAVKHQNMPESKIATDFYSPGDSRLISFSSFFCNSVRFSVESQATGASFFLVDSAPPLTDQNNFMINANFTLDRNNYHFWQYHLYPNSKVTLDVCTDCSRVFLNIYLVKGNTNVNRWGDEPGANHAQLFQSVSMVCPDKQTLAYTVTKEDEYYIIVHNSFSKIELYYDLTLAVERFEYKSLSLDMNSTIHDHCAVSSGETCTVDIPYGTSSQQALVVTTIPEDVDWTENVAVKTSCSRRHWAYVVVVLVPLFVAAVGIAIVILVILWCCCCAGSDQTKTSDGVDNTDNIDKVDNPDNIDTVAIECNDFDNIDKIDT